MMSSKKQSPDISTKQIFSGGILFGMINLPFMAFAQDTFENKSLWDKFRPLFFEHYWLFGAISIIGCILAWATPNSLAAWRDPAANSVKLIPLVFISTCTYRLLSNLIQHNFVGAITILLFTTALLCCYSLSLAIYGRLKAKRVR
jgi:hypothetical protein